MKSKLTLVMLLWGLCAWSQTASQYQVVIDEIMADPSPVVQLPNAEYIELKNVSGHAFNLNGWRIGDAAGFATIAVNFTLQADSFVIICANSNASFFAVFGNVIGVANFPSLDNTADLIYLRSKEGSTIHAVSYSSAWFQNSVKEQGGWSLEMMDTRNPCSGALNWMASNNGNGGTPGKKNSVDGTNTDQQPPVLLGAFAADSANIVLTFDEPLDSLAAVNTAAYTISDAIGSPQKAAALPPLFNQIRLQTAIALAKEKVYSITAGNIADCAGNAPGAYHTAKLGLVSVATNLDLVFNEILFNPKPDGTDYIELYNRSKKNINLKDCYITSRSASGTVGTPRAISTTDRLLFPGGYMVVTENETLVKKQYLAKDPFAFAVMTAMPVMANDKGDILLLNAQGQLLDELAYDEHWHFPLISNNEGVALERIDYNKPTQEAANWHSAATSAGYGTPGYQNSQLRNDAQVQGIIAINPAVFSPDNDGFDDFLTIQYQFPDPGYVCTITAFDAGGHAVRSITRNALCGLQGYFRWDGLDEKNNKLPVGVYVILADVFNLQGKTKRVKQAVTLARRL